MADRQIKALTEETSVATGDWYVMQKGSNDTTVKVDAENILPDSTVTGAKLGTPVAFSAINESTTVNLVASSFTIMQFPTEQYDLGGNFASNVFTAPYTGVYNFSAAVRTVGTDSASANERMIIAFYVDGTQARGVSTSDLQTTGGGYQISCHISADILLTAGEDVDVRVFTDDGVDNGNVTSYQFFTGHLIGRT